MWSSALDQRQKKASTPTRARTLEKKKKGKRTKKSGRKSFPVNAAASLPAAVPGDDLHFQTLEASVWFTLAPQTLSIRRLECSQTEFHLKGYPFLPMPPPVPPPPPSRPYLSGQTDTRGRLSICRALHCRCCRAIRGAAVHNVAS